MLDVRRDAGQDDPKSVWLFNREPKSPFHVATA